jgi:hypothetical protein
VAGTGVIIPALRGGTESFPKFDCRGRRGGSGSSQMANLVCLESKNFTEII